MPTWTSDLDFLADVSTHVHVNGNGQPHTIADGSLKDLKAIILAGGRGTRLAPYTSVLPKPLMPIGDQSILEVVVEQLEQAGVVDIQFCVGYLAHLIEAVFDSRQNGHVNITYVREQEALGTAGPLRLVNDLESTFIVMNGDILTTLDYRDLVAFHRENGNALTIATHERSIKVDYGILHLDDDSRVRGFEEKPQIQSRVSMGIYVMEPEVLEFIPTDRHFDLPDLVHALIAADLPVGGYRHDGLWYDIGRVEDYADAAQVWLNRDAPNGNGHADGNGHPNGNGHANGNGRATVLGGRNGSNPGGGADE
jgi:NDP-mannose synthase